MPVSFYLRPICRIRKETAPRLLRHLSEDENSRLKLPDLSKFDADLLDGMLILEEVLHLRKQFSASIQVFIRIAVGSFPHHFKPELMGRVIVF